MPRGRPPKGGPVAAGRGAGGSGRGRGRPKKDASSLSPAPELHQQQQQPAGEPYQEDVWVQCDACQKWRRLPPSTTLEDDVPWYCNMNPDTNYRSCEIPEENYDAAKEVVVASTDPYYANLIPKDAEALRRELLAKATQLQTEAKVEAQAEQRRRKQTADKNATVFATVKDELQALVKACQQIINNAGSWLPPTPSTSPAVQQQQHQTGNSVPQWVWSGLQHFAPKPAQVAAQANEVLVSLECFAPGAQQAAEAAASEAGIRISDPGAGGPSVPGDKPPKTTTTSTPASTTPTTLPSLPADAPTSHIPTTSSAAHMSGQQSEQQRQRQLQQIEAARVHARLALLIAASISLPSAVQAQAAPDSLVLPSTSSSKSGKGKQQQQQQPQQQRGRPRSNSNSNSWLPTPSTIGANGATPPANNMFALPGMMSPFPFPTGFDLGAGQAGNPFAGLLGALQSPGGALLPALQPFSSPQPQLPPPPQQQQQQQLQTQQLQPPPAFSPEWAAAFMGISGGSPQLQQQPQLNSIPPVQPSPLQAPLSGHTPLPAGGSFLGLLQPELPLHQPPLPGQQMNGSRAQQQQQSQGIPIESLDAQHSQLSALQQPP